MRSRVNVRIPIDSKFGNLKYMHSSNMLLVIFFLNQNSMNKFL